jgi:hypothetical protein
MYERMVCGRDSSCAVCAACAVCAVCAVRAVCAVYEYGVCMWCMVYEHGVRVQFIHGAVY